ncbi:MAG TPA: tRNA 2-thiouridine(34) synthase MnmA [Herpetosiphonaceae bacterium]
MAKIMVAMSGGVDSSLAAVLLREQGHEVTGVTMHLWEGDDEGLMESQCCSIEMTAGARRVCAQFDIPYYVFNYQKEFRSHVINYFLREYSSGATPNPCLACNRDLKFRVLLERAQALGFDALATGHFVRVTGGGDEPYDLRRGVDPNKDQSYVLYMLQQPELARLSFPLGGYTKPQVRELARQRGLATADKPESMDICFIPDNNYRRFLAEEQPEIMQPGPIVRRDGTVLGEHKGLPQYTIGQRKGLGVAAGAPLFVLELDTARNLLIVGDAEELDRREFLVEDLRLVYGPGSLDSRRCEVQIRAHGTADAATVAMQADGRLLVRYDEPQRAISPGQAAVFYDGERVLGGGRIAGGRPA